MRILCSDYDGTFSHGGIDDLKKQAVSKWREQGNVFALVSGRAVYSLKSLQKEHSFECDYFVAQNGAVLARTDGTIVYSNEIDKDIVVPVVKLLIEKGCKNALVENNESSFFVCPNKNCCNKPNMYTLDELPEIEYCTQIFVTCPDVETANNVTAALKARYKDKLNPMQCGGVIYVVKANNYKSKGIANLTDLLGMTHGDVIVVGDHMNDKDMIEAFRSYAMENGVDEIKKIADYTTKSVTALIEKELSEN